MDSVSVALLESAYREYEDKQRLNLEVLKTMIQAVCRRVGGESGTGAAAAAAVKSDVTERLARLEELIRGLSMERVQPAVNTFIPAVNFANEQKGEVRHIHIEPVVTPPTPVPVPAPSTTPILMASAVPVDEVKHLHLVEEKVPRVSEERVIDEEVVVEEVEEEEIVVEEEVEVEVEAEEEAEAELELEEFTWKGKTYYKDDDNNVYDVNDEGEPEKIGTLVNGKIMLD